MSSRTDWQAYVARHDQQDRRSMASIRAEKEDEKAIRWLLDTFEFEPSVVTHLRHPSPYLSANMRIRWALDTFEFAPEDKKRLSICGQEGRKEQ